MIQGFQKYNKIPVPVLAIYALPDVPQKDDPSAVEIADLREKIVIQADAFEKSVPTARVVRIPHAQHYVFRSNEAEVLREMNAFLAGLK